jgi:hypothetical protein
MANGNNHLVSIIALLGTIHQDNYVIARQKGVDIAT